MKFCRIILQMIANRSIAILSNFNRKITLNFKFFRFDGDEMNNKARSEKKEEESLKFLVKSESNRQKTHISGEIFL
ncbi:hypothetical protein Hanom_Chr03g00208361 [Helianthus anomalus]